MIDWHIIKRLAENVYRISEPFEAKVSGRPRDGFFVGQEFRFAAFSVWLPR